MSGYQRVFRCPQCANIQSDHHLGVCWRCGSDGQIIETVARWIDTTTFWQRVTLLCTGYWEIKRDVVEKLKENRFGGN